MKENPTLNKKLLTEDIAAPQVGGVRRAWNSDTIASGLTPSKLASVLSAANDGDTNDYLTLAEEMEEREPHYGSVLRTRKLAIEGLTRTVTAQDDVKEEIVDAVQKLVDDSAFDALVSGLVDALGKGYAAVEILWDENFMPAQYKWRDPRYFQFAKDNGYKLLLRSDTNRQGEELPPYKFVVHLPKLKSGIPIRGGLARMAALSYMCKTYALTDWMAFCEVFGMPVRIGKYGNGASDEDKAILKRAVTHIGTDAAAIVPESMHIEFVQATSTGGENLFENLANWLDKQVSKAVLGQTMTADDGSSQSQANIHNEVRLDLLRADAKQLAAAINQQLIEPFVKLQFGEQENYPQLTFFISEEEDLNALVDGVAKLAPLGLKVSQAFLRNKLGIPEPQPDEELLTITTTPQPETDEKPAKKQALNSVQRAFNEPQNSAKSLVDQQVEQLDTETQPQVDHWLQAIQDKVQQAESLEDIKAAIDSLIPELSYDEYATLLAKASISANFAGRYSVDQERKTKE